MQIVTYDIDKKQVKLFLQQLPKIAIVAHINLANQQLSSRTLSDMPVNSNNRNTTLDMLDRTMEARNVISRVIEALEHMPHDSYKNIIKLRYLYELSYENIGDQLAISSRHVIRLIQDKALKKFALAYGMFD